MLDGFLASFDAPGLARVSMWSEATPLVALVEWNGLDRRRQESASLTLYSVPATEAASTREAMLREVLPAVAEWLRSLRDASETTRAMNHRLAFELHDGEIIRTET